MLNPVGEELWTVEGPIVSFYSSPYPTRMAVARLANRQLWLWSPIPLTSEFAEQLEKHDKSAFLGSRRRAMQLDGMVGPGGSTPREWRATFKKRAVARAGRDTMLDWNPRQLIVAHGPIIRENAKDVIASSLARIG